MSCLVYNHEDSITDWLHLHGIFNKFIHNSINTLTGFLDSSNIDYDLSISDKVQLTAGVPLVTTFIISADKVVCSTLGTLTVVVDSWDATLDTAASENLLKTAVFSTVTKQDVK